MSDSEIICRAIRMFGCDSARIINPMGRMFLVLGWKGNTKDDKSGAYWTTNGERFDFEYNIEKVVASGDTPEELLASMREYKRLSGMTMEQYLKEMVAGATGG